jgi:hypothetical protein
MPSPDDLERVLLGLPIMQNTGQHVTAQTTALRRHEDFAADKTAVKREKSAARLLSEQADLNVISVVPQA